MPSIDLTTASLLLDRAKHAENRSAMRDSGQITKLLDLTQREDQEVVLTSLKALSEAAKEKGNKVYIREHGIFQILKLRKTYREKDSPIQLEIQTILIYLKDGDLENQRLVELTDHIVSWIDAFENSTASITRGTLDALNAFLKQENAIAIFENAKGTTSLTQFIKNENNTSDDRLYAIQTLCYLSKQSPSIRRQAIEGGAIQIAKKLITNISNWDSLSTASLHLLSQLLDEKPSEIEALATPEHLSFLIQDMQSPKPEMTAASAALMSCMAKNHLSHKLREALGSLGVTPILSYLSHQETPVREYAAETILNMLNHEPSKKLFLESNAATALSEVISLEEKSEKLKQTSIFALCQIIELSPDTSLGKHQSVAAALIIGIDNKDPAAVLESAKALHLLSEKNEESEKMLVLGIPIITRLLSDRNNPQELKLAIISLANVLAKDTANHKQLNQAGTTTALLSLCRDSETQLPALQVIATLMKTPETGSLIRDNNGGQILSACTRSNNPDVSQLAKSISASSPKNRADQAALTMRLAFASGPISPSALRKKKGRRKKKTTTLAPKQNIEPNAIPSTGHTRSRSADTSIFNLGRRSPRVFPSTSPSPDTRKAAEKKPKERKIFLEPGKNTKEETPSSPSTPRENVSVESTATI